MPPPAHLTFHTSLLHYFGLNTLRSRYLAAVVAGSIIVTLLSLNGWWSLETVTDSQLAKIQHRAQALDTMSNSVMLTHTLETQVYRFISMPTHEGQTMMQQTMAAHGATLDKLMNNPWIQGDNNLREQVNTLNQASTILTNKVKRLIEIRSDQKQWFPLLTIMQEKMLAQSIEFNSALELMSQELTADLSDPTNIEVYKTLMEIRNNWQLMLLEFRLFVTNSVAVFTEEPERMILPRISNVETYYHHVTSLLDKLREFERAGKLDLIGQSSLQDMDVLVIKWKENFQRISSDFRSDNWRHDLVYLRESVEPQLTQFHQLSTDVQNEMNTTSAQDITQLTEVARHFSSFMIYLALGLIIAGLIGFYIFHRTILLPIARVAQALKDEASGRQGIIIPHSTAEEIQDLTQAFASMRDQIRAREAHLDHMAHHDALTQLPNRTLFQLRLEHALVQSKRNNTQVGLMFLDLDRFKQINDTLGHDVGDQLLTVVANKLANCMRSSDTIARLGGDEFAIILENIIADDQLIAAANKILKEFIAPITIDHHELHTTTSIGIALGPRDAATVDALTKNADIAMYHAKSLGRNNLKFYSQEMTSEVIYKVTLENQLHHAIENQEFRLYYQPIVDLRSGRVISTEALLRWQHPERGLLAPGEFLVVLNESGLIKPLTQWILREVGRQYMIYKNAGHADVRISVNLCGSVFRHDSILDMVVSAIEHTRMDPRGLILEITEDTLLEDIHGAQQALRTLQGMGIQIALDDFGTGQSSLNHLRQSPIDIVKIDRDFIRDVPTDNSDSELVDAIIAMTHKLHIKVVAEGVETQQQLDFLRWRKCDAIQGYYISRPVPAETVMTFFNEPQRMLG